MMIRLGSSKIDARYIKFSYMSQRSAQFQNAIPCLKEITTEIQFSDLELKIVQVGNLLV